MNARSSPPVSRVTRIGTPPASVARNEPGSATCSARPPYCHERAKICARSRRSSSSSPYQENGSVRASAAVAMRRCYRRPVGHGSARLEARTAARLVGIERSDLDRRTVERGRLAVDEPLCHRRRPAATVADRFELVDELRDAEEGRHGAERQPAEVLREPGCDDTCAVRDKDVDRVDDLVVEELHLVDPN